jgi:NADPH-dependent ferric siderophore reductase
MSSGQSFGDSDDSPADEAAMHAIAALMEEIQPDSIVTKFVLLVETIEEEDRYFSAMVSPQMKRWDTMGMLQYAQCIEDSLFEMTEPPGDDDG